MSLSAQNAIATCACTTIVSVLSKWRAAVVSVSRCRAGAARSAVACTRDCRSLPRPTSTTRPRSYRMWWMARATPACRRTPPCGAGGLNFAAWRRISRRCCKRCSRCGNRLIRSSASPCWIFYAGRFRRTGQLLSCRCSLSIISSLPPSLPVSLAARVVCSLHKDERSIPHEKSTSYPGRNGHPTL